MATEPHATPAILGAHSGAVTQESHEGTAAAGHESSGLPQFDFQWWPGQIAWFLIVFAALATVYLNEVVNFGHGH